MEIPELITRFKHDLTQMSVREIVQRHVTYGLCHVLDQDRYFKLKSVVAAEFKIHHSEVLLVGSGKLGFSIAPTKRYRGFADTSDIDVAIVSPVLFDAVWSEAYEFWETGAFWRNRTEFQDYLFRGWIRPDKLPSATVFERSRDWWDFFRELSTSEQFGPYRIRAGLYRSWQFLESYQTVCVAQCWDAERAKQ